MPDKTLAQLVREKYPEAYKEVSDRDLEAAVIAKYPGVYDHLPRTPEAKPVSDWAAGKAHAARGATDLAIAAAKGVGETVAGLGDIIYRTVPPVRVASDLVQKGVAAVTGGTFTPADQIVSAMRQDPSVLKASNQTQQIGKGIEQAAEFFLLPAGTGSLATKAATQAVGSGLLSAAQGSGAGGTTAGAVLGAAGPVVGKAVSAVGAGLKEAAKKGVVKAMGPTKEKFKAVAEKVAPEFLDRRVGGWLGKGRKALLEEASEKASEAGRAVDNVLQQQGAQTVSGQTIKDGIEQAKQAYISPDTGVVLDKRVVGHLSKLQELIDKLGPNPTVTDIVATRRVWDRVVSQAGGFEHRAAGAIGIPLQEVSEAWAKREGTKAIREVLSQAVPDLAAVNKEYAFWKGIKDVVGQTLKREAPQKPGLGKTILTAAGMSAGAMSGDSPMDKAEKILLYGALANRASAAFRSPQWKLISANLKNELADAIASGSVGKVTSVLHRVTLATNAQATR